MTYLIEVENRFQLAQRAIMVRRRTWEEALEETTIDYPAAPEADETAARETALLSLGTLEYDDDYLEITVDNSGLEMGPCRVELPADTPFSFIAYDPGSVTVLPNCEGTAVNVLRIPSGLPTWKLEIMRPPQTEPEISDQPAVIQQLQEEEEIINNVTVGDDEPGGGGQDKY